MGQLRRGLPSRHPVMLGTFALTLIVAGIALGSVGPSAGPSGAQPSSPYTVIPGDSTFNQPVAVSSDGTHVWVANDGTDSVSELDAATGALVQVISGPSYGFAQPDAVSSDGTHVWVANLNPRYGNSVTELNAATGALVQVISGANEFDAPQAIAVDGTHVWVLNNYTDYGNPANSNWSVVELDAATGALLHVTPIQGAHIATQGSDMDLTSDGTHAWVATWGYWVGQTDHPGFITEIDASTGAVTRVINEANIDPNFLGAGAISASGGYVWVSGDTEVAKINAATGTTVQVIPLSSYGYGNALGYISAIGGKVWMTVDTNLIELDASTGALLAEVPDLVDLPLRDYPKLSADGTHVWVVNTGRDSVAEVSASTGALVQVIHGNSDQLAEPSAIAVDGTHTWVVNASAGSVTELDESTGALVQVISGPLTEFDAALNYSMGEDSISADGAHVWVVNPDNKSITELDASTGALVRVIPVPGIPVDVTSNGTDVWVANWWTTGVPEYQSPGSLTEIDAATGAVIQTLNASSGETGIPYGMCATGTHLWVINHGYWTGTQWTSSNLTEIDATTGAPVSVVDTAGSWSIACDNSHVWLSSGSQLTEVDAATGATVRTISAPDTVDELSSDGVDVWAISRISLSVVEYNATTGAVVQDLSDPRLGFDYPVAILSDGSSVWVANKYGNSVTKMSADIGPPIAFTSMPPSNAQVGGAPYTVAASGGVSGNPVVFSIDAASTTVCSISGDSVSFLGAGTCTIDANRAAGDGYPAAFQAQQSIAVGAQAITFTTTPPAEAQVGDPAYTVAATGGGSGNPVLLSIDAASTSVCSISSQTVSFIGAGTCTVDANQAGSGGYLPAPQAQQSFLVGDPPITFTSTPPLEAVVRGPTYTVSATGAPSDVPVLFSSATPTVCTVSGSTVSFIGAGTCTVDADQAGTALYLASTGSQSFVVSNTQTMSLCSNATTLVGATYSCLITTTGSPAPFQKRIGKLPPGLIFVDHRNGSATISGTARIKTGGNYSVEILATFGSSGGKSLVMATLNLTVDEAPSIISVATKAAHVGAPVTAVIRTRGFPKPAIGLEAGALPSGVTFTDKGNGTAVLAGTPASGSAGIYTVTIGASNGVGNPAAQSFTLVVRA
jgi:hypothetical protein